MGHRLLRIEKVAALIVKAHIHGDDVRIAPRVAVNAGVVHSAGRIQLAGCRIIARKLAAQVFHLLWIFLMVGVGGRRRAVGKRRQVHEDGHDVAVVIVTIIITRSRWPGNGGVGRLRILHQAAGEIIIACRIGGGLFVRGHRKAPVIGIVGLDGGDDGAHLRLGLGFERGVFHLGKHRQEHRGQDGDDGNDGEEFDQSEGIFSAVFYVCFVFHRFLIIVEKLDKNGMDNCWLQYLQNSFCHQLK